MNKFFKGIMESTAPRSFYRRPLPNHLIAFSSEKGKELFKQSLKQGYTENYFKLVGNFSSQSEPAYCGLASLVTVLNSFEIDPGKTWKGIWRWYSEEMLDCCSPLSYIKQNGITFQEFKCLAHCNGLQVSSFHPSESSLEQFRAAIAATCQSSEQHLVVSFGRKSLGQTGDGHFSPIAAYSREHDSVLVLEVARFKYPCYWVDVEMLWRAMHDTDSVTGRQRGYFVLKRDCAWDAGLVRVGVQGQVKELGMVFEDVLGRNLEGVGSGDAQKMKDVFRGVLEELDRSKSFRLEFVPPGIDLVGQGEMATQHEKNVYQLICDIQRHPVYQIACDILQERRLEFLGLQSGNSLNAQAALATLLFLALPEHCFDKLNHNFKTELHNFRNIKEDFVVLRREVERLTKQIGGSMKICSCKKN
ncbi:Phytochelatin synthase domain-containing protein [Rozella allomycis CSF55]|uniref:glutathione gamma-glutamylcysteinyltransferase n=1 Tax=Rozella allomycis (strain CSF55) TaxID=988480 RepID=A0A075B0A7_ROZAC|nr:Phytochelatin synthase domain-containing protein [Rozella allomycis CSF55]|eukprot:EPZ35810.1 Phytochelatin synthase domain-containing protein [Rozella allomycis CSF55]